MNSDPALNPIFDPREQDPPTLFGSEPDPSVPTLGEWALIRYMGNPVGEVYLLNNLGLSIGRARENGITLAEPEVSRHHAQVELVNQGEAVPVPMITDLGSTNGTYLNGRHLTPADGQVLLRHGDVIRLGSHAFKVKHMDELERNYHETVLNQTTLDHLTGVGNRASVLAFLEKHADLSRRHRRPMSVILCDLDHFKAVNDRFGHAAGDRVLQAFSSLVAGRLRSSDHMGRIGGEEFLVVLPETGGREAKSLAEELRKGVAAEILADPCGQLNYQLTCCFGVVQLGEDDLDHSTLLARADAALYRAKGKGRNRVEFDGKP
jgi:diguanylate cyclase (GGDEF)-like protein